MPKQIQFQYDQTGLSTLYALVRKPDTAEVWSVAGGAFATYAEASRDDYDVALAEVGAGSRYYAADFPATIPRGTYWVHVYLKAGATPAGSDVCMGEEPGGFRWDGTTVVHLDPAGVADKILGRSVEGAADGGRTVSEYLQGYVNKVVQSADGTAITVYRSDDATVLQEIDATRLATTVGGVKNLTPE